MKMLKTKNIVSLDIDGILTDYPKCWLKFIYLHTGQHFKAIEQAKIAIKDDYSRLKRLYRSSEYKEFLPLLPQANVLIDFLRDKGYNFIISTSRPILSPEFPALYDITKNWVCRNVGPDCPVYFKDETLQFIPNLHKIDFHIDDELRFAQAFASKDVFSYFVTCSNYIDRTEEAKDLTNILTLKTHDEIIFHMQSKDKT